MNTYKIGEEIGFSQDFEIESVISATKAIVKAGDKGYIDSRCNVHYTTGQARGKIQHLDNAEMKGYDYTNIAKMLFKKLKNEFMLEEHLEGYDFSEKDFIEEIEDILNDIL